MPFDLSETIDLSDEALNAGQEAAEAIAVIRGALEVGSAGGKKITGKEARRIIREIGEAVQALGALAVALVLARKS